MTGAAAGPVYTVLHHLDTGQRFALAVTDMVLQETFPFWFSSGAALPIANTLRCL
jgi:hypothetical protein